MCDKHGFGDCFRYFREEDSGDGFAKKAACFILAHNHPDGDPVPSENDITVTNEYCTLFTKLGMPLIEHFVIGGSSYRTIFSGASPV